MSLFTAFLLFPFFSQAKNLTGHSISSDTSKLISENYDASTAMLYAPVCAGNKRTYINEKSAKRAGETDLKKGRCSNYMPVFCVQPDRLWIAEVAVNDMSEKSEAEGYRNAANIVFELHKKGGNVISLTHKPNTDIGVQQWKVWIDFDKDTLFEEHELVIDDVAADISIPLNLPSTARTGILTRMRVFMGPRGSKIEAGKILSGEVEDFTVEVK